MEYLLYFIAAALAGIGTGLAGLSAATVMVPILIVLCPGFQGENGAYQATAIALASDILGSAVTAYTYGKNKKIDLKRGWIMLVSILAMCTVGSYVAFLAGNVVLGTFTLFLTFFIGIRFLVKPDTSKEKTAKKGEKLGARGVAVSLFFGLTIGFGTGFVGTGGGMMMLVVFTAFLGMELKTAVGTSTFIMTFTALIASVSHILINPAIVLERWDALIICITVATLFSRLSALFANRVSNRTVGLVTGAVLAVLGAMMLILNFWDVLSGYPLIVEIISSMKVLALAIVAVALLIVVLQLIFKFPKYVFRKLLHLVAFSCVCIMLHFAESWQAAVLVNLIFAALIYPILALLEKESWYGSLFVEKSKGEVKRSLVMLFCMYAALIFVSWGLLGKAYLAAAAILMWGPGDAAAALVGIPFGKHKIKLKITDGKKSLEGTLAMFVTSALFGGLYIGLFTDTGIVMAVIMAVFGGVTAAFTELVSDSEWDTVTVPVSVLVVLALLSFI